MDNGLFDKKQLYIVDGYALIYRSYFAMISKPIRDGEGNNVSAVFGFFKTVMKILRDYHPDYLVVALDSRVPTFRHKLYAPYKANREKAPEDLHSQVPVIERVLREMNVPFIAKDGFEADDIIATLCAEAERHDIETVVFTGDKDLLQLVGPSVRALRPPKPRTSAYRVFREKEVREEFGVGPSQIVDYLSLIGDSSDNVPGVAGIGPVGAAKLLGRYGTMEEIYKHIDEMSPSVKKKLIEAKDHMELTRTLILLRGDLFTVPSFDTPQYRTAGISWEKAAGIFDSLKLPSLSREALSFCGGRRAPAEEERAGESAKRGTYVGLTDMEELEALLASAPDVLAWDTETN